VAGTGTRLARHAGFCGGDGLAARAGFVHFQRRQRQTQHGRRIVGLGLHTQGRCAVQVLRAAGGIQRLERRVPDRLGPGRWPQHEEGGPEGCSHACVEKIHA
jgi:hypothetical protein